MADGVMKFGVGQPVRRREDDRFLRGAGRYVTDVTLPEQAYAYFLRSPHAHGVIQSLDVDEARAAPGVLAVLTHEDVTAAGLTDLANQTAVKNADGSAIAPVTMPPLARDRVRFVGQPVAMIVAESLDAARDAAELIMFDVDELPPVTTPETARAEDAPQLHQDAPGNIAYRWAHGDADKAEAALNSGAHRVQVSVVNQRMVVNPLEPRSVNASYDAEDGRWTIYCGTQGSHGMAAGIARNLGVDKEKVRVITPDVGGGFGMKLMLHAEYALAATASRSIGRPVKWVGDRGESFLSDAQARDLQTEAEAAFDADGKLLAMRARSVSNIGAYYSQFGAGIHTDFSATLLGAFYRCPVMRSETIGVFTNTTSTDAYRGAGRPEMAFIAERLMDAAARQIGIDPVEIRRRNLLTAADMPYHAAGGHVIDSGDAVNTMEKALAAADYAGAEARKADSKARGLTRGVGVAYYVERTGGGPAEHARLRVRGDGRITAWIGTQSTGQGHETVWAQLVHEKLGVDPNTVDLLPGDSDLLPGGGGTGGSRSLIMAHRVFFLAAEDVIEKGRAAASKVLEAAIADIEFSAAEGGVFRIAGTDRSIDLFAAAAAAEASGEGEGAAEAGEILGLGDVSDRMPTFPNGAHVCEVELDPATGVIDLVRHVVADDMGKIMNPLLAEGQIQGGMAQGVGQVLCEIARWDPETGQPLTGSFMDYQLPRADDFPAFEVSFTEEAPSPTNPMGVKGAGEAGTLGAISGVTMAVLDALRQHGIEQMDPPYTPLRVWQAIRDASGS